MLTPDDQLLDLGGLRIAVRLWGPADGKPVLALHGWLDNAASFDPLAPLLSGVRLCALDFAGHGLSDHRPPRTPYHFVDYVSDAVGVADALGWSEFSLLGHSMGAGVACLVAAALPERVTGMVCLDGFGPISSPSEKAPENLRRAVIQLQTEQPRKLVIFPDLDACARARVTGAHSSISVAAAKILATRNTQPHQQGLVWRTDPRLKFCSPLKLTEPQVMAFLAQIEAPVLVIGARDGYASMTSDYKARFAAPRQVSQAVLPGGHHFHMEQSAADVAGLVNAFWSPGAAGQG